MVVAATCRKITDETLPEQVLRRYPRLIAHMVCESLGYFTPGSAANALKNYALGRPNACEWYIHMAQRFSDAELIEVGRKVVAGAFRDRAHHVGYMAHYPLARKLVGAELAGHGPILASWF